MPPHTVLTTMLGGLLGTVVQSRVVYGVDPLIAAPSRPSNTVAAISPNKLYVIALHRLIDISRALTVPEPIADFHWNR